MNKHAVALATLALCAAMTAEASTSGLVIHQIYGSGGSSGATWRNDYIELLNTGTQPVSLAGKSLQYASATGTGTFASNTPLAVLPAVTLQPGQYFLVSGASSGTNGSLLPTPDATWTRDLSGSGGKVILADTVNGVPCNGGATPCSPADLALIIDLVGYGGANFFEGSAAPSPSTTLSITRQGCADTDVNGADFRAGTPEPRNSASPAASCNVVAPLVLTIPQIQGVGATSPFAGQLAQTSGVVTRVNNNGFYLQDATGDGDPATSDGIFVFTGSAPTVVAGDLVQLQGTVTEFNVGAAGNPDTTPRPLTELTGIAGLQVIGSGFSVAPTLVTLPETVNDDLERVEGMLVTINGPLIVSQNFFQGRFGQVTLSAGGRLETPTNRFRPGTPEALAQADLNARARLLLDDGTSQQNPNPTPYIGADDTLRAGDTVDTLTGVIDYGLATASSAGFGDYRLQPTAPVSITRTNPRTVTPDGVGGNLRVASFNVLNYFTTFTDGNDAFGNSGQGCTLGGAVSASNCRGASNGAEFNRQRAKIIEALAAIDADAVGLIELQNNGPVAIQNLVDGLNARIGANVWAALPDAAAGTGTDAIKVGLIYKPARLAPAGPAQSDTDPVNNRPTLAQTFAAPNGEQVTVVVNHFKSKSCSDATGADLDAGDGQGCYNATRLAQAQRLRAWLSGLPGATGDVLILGDLNAYAKEDPIVELTGNGYADQIGRFNSFGYGFVFDGAAGRLDHALASAPLVPKVTRALEWHINADEPSVIDYNTEFKQPLCATCGPDYYSATPYRSSDHDPVVVGLSIYRFVTGTPADDKRLSGTPGDDWFIGGTGVDRITTGTGADIVALQAFAEARDVVNDFVPGQDRIDLRGLLADIGYAGADPVADRVLRVIDGSGGAVVQIDADGAGRVSRWTTVVTLRGVAAASVVIPRDVITDDGALRRAAYRKAPQRVAR